MISKRKTRGFTLIEMLAAFLILVMGMMGILGVYITSLEKERSAVIKTRISGALPFIEWELKERVAESKGNLKEVVDESVPGFPSIKWSSKFYQIENWPGEVFSEVTVKWLEGGYEKQVTFPFLITKYEPYVYRIGKVNSKKEYKR